MPKIAVVALDGAYMAGLGAVLDMFDLANRYTVGQYGAVDAVKKPGDVCVLTTGGGAARLACGRKLSADGAWGGDEAFDLIYIAGFDVADEEAIERRLEADALLCAWLRERHAQGALIAASGAASLYPVAAGLYEHHVAAAPWWLERLFRRRFPHVSLDVARIIAEGEGALCAGTTRGEPALALRLAERVLSQNVANWLAKQTLIDPYPDGPEPWTVFSPRVLREDGMVGRAQHWLQQRFSQRPRMSDLAEAMRVSERTLERRFQHSLGMTPLAYLQMLRIEAAKHMLARSSRRVERVAYLVGYADASFFKQVFRAHAGVSPREYRRRERALVTKTS